MKTLAEYHHTGGLVKEVDLSIPNQMWQHPWHLVHRVALHDSLKKAATSTEGPGPTPELRTASKVVEVDADAGKVKFLDGTETEVDVIVGADGIYVCKVFLGLCSLSLTNLQVENQKCSGWRCQSQAFRLGEGGFPLPDFSKDSSGRSYHKAIGGKGQFTVYVVWFRQAHRDVSV